MTWFQCGCCGADFASTVEEQARHDQDDGFGICPDCEAWIDQRNGRDWQELRELVAGALSEHNRARFLAMPDELQRWCMGKLIDRGAISWKIKVA